jgi:hypothetical protein
MKVTRGQIREIIREALIKESQESPVTIGEFIATAGDGTIIFEKDGIRSQYVFYAYTSENIRAHRLPRDHEDYEDPEIFGIMRILNVSMDGSDLVMSYKPYLGEEGRIPLPKGKTKIGQEIQEKITSEVSSGTDGFWVKEITKSFPLVGEVSLLIWAQKIPA